MKPSKVSNRLHHLKKIKEEVESLIVNHEVNIRILNREKVKTKQNDVLISLQQQEKQFTKEWNALQDKLEIINDEISIESKKQAKS